MLQYLGSERIGLKCMFAEELQIEAEEEWLEVAVIDELQISAAALQELILV